LKKSTKVIVIVCSNLFCVGATVWLNYFFGWPEEAALDVAAIVMALSLGTIIGIKLAK